MSKGRVPKVVRQARGLNHILVKATDRRYKPGGRSDLEEFGESPSNLGDLDGMRQPVVKDVALGCMYNLSDASEPSEKRAIQNAIAVSLEFAPLVLGSVIFVAAIFADRVRQLLSTEESGSDRSIDLESWGGGKLPVERDAEISAVNQVPNRPVGLGFCV
jgi:hypothetical protein